MPMLTATRESLSRNRTAAPQTLMRAKHHSQTRPTWSRPHGTDYRGTAGAYWTQAALNSERA